MWKVIFPQMLKIWIWRKAWSRCTYWFVSHWERWFNDFEPPFVCVICRSTYPAQREESVIWKSMRMYSARKIFEAATELWVLKTKMVIIFMWQEYEDHQVCLELVHIFYDKHNVLSTGHECQFSLCLQNVLCVEHDLAYQSCSFGCSSFHKAVLNSSTSISLSIFEVHFPICTLLPCFPPESRSNQTHRKEFKIEILANTLVPKFQYLVERKYKMNVWSTIWFEV